MAAQRAVRLVRAQRDGGAAEPAAGERERRWRRRRWGWWRRGGGAGAQGRELGRRCAQGGTQHGQARSPWARPARRRLVMRPVTVCVAWLDAPM